jgi:uncharacterized protein (DUF58 family)
VLVGSHRSPRSGQAVEFSEHRQYVPGDDLRGLDWKVLGRTDKYYLRQREDETTLDCHLIVDCSGSMAYQGPRAPADKLNYAVRVSAALAFVAVENHDRVALTTIGHEVVRRLGFAGGSEQLMALASVMEGVEADDRGAEGEAEVAVRLVEAVQTGRRTGLLVLVGDLFDPVEPLAKALRAVRTSGREVLAIQIYDPAEEEFPFVDTLEFVGLEGEPGLVADARGVAAAYREQFALHQQQLRAACLECEAQLWTLRTDQPLAYRLPELLSTL